jgi:hypothetical protein
MVSLATPALSGYGKGAAWFGLRGESDDALALWGPGGGEIKGKKKKLNDG